MTRLKQAWLALCVHLFGYGQVKPGFIYYNGKGLVREPKRPKGKK